LLTDKEWLSQIGERWEDTEDDEDISELIPGKKKKGAGRKKDGTPESGEPAKRGRKRKKAMDEEVWNIFNFLLIKGCKKLSQGFPILKKFLTIFI